MTSTLALWCMANVTLAAALAISAPGIVTNAWPYECRALERWVALGAIEFVALGAIVANAGMMLMAINEALGIG